MRDSFTIYRNTLEALESLPPDLACKVLSYIGHYAMDGVEPDNSDMIAYAFFKQIQPLIDRNNRRAEAGKAGGSKQNEANVKQTEANRKQTEANVSKPQANKKREIRKEKEEIINTLSCASSEYQYKEVIDYLNDKAGTAFKDKSKDTRSHIKARFDDGFTLQDFYTVIDNKVAEWGGTDMAKFLRPATLFGTKFESYLNQQAAKPKVSTFNNFPQRSYDYEDLERRLSGVIV